MTPRSALLVLCSTAVAAVAGTELLHWSASRRYLPRAPRPGGPGGEVVLVLGCPSAAGGDLHPVQRWRTDIAVRSLSGPEGRFVFSGGGPDPRRSEALVMATYAHDVHGVAWDRIALETRSRTTWENVTNSVPLLEGARTIRIASAPTHAARGRRYLARLRPDLALLLAPGEDYRFGEQLPFKVASLAYGAARMTLRTLRPGTRTPPLPP